MLRPLMLATLLATSAASAAQAQSTGGPSIAYAKAGGTAMEIYLVNPNGTGLTKLYTAPRKTSVGFMDLRPGGNELAFTEGFRIKIQRFFDSGQPNGAATLLDTPCQAWHPDYHPSGDGSFVFLHVCGGTYEVRQYVPGVGMTTLFSTISTNRVRWNRAGTHLYYDEETSFNSGNLHLKRRDIASGVVEDLGDMGCTISSCLDSFEVGRAGDRVLFGPTTGPKLFDSATMSGVSQATAVCINRGGTDLHFSPGDANLIYRTPHSARGDYIMIAASNCSGAPGALTGKGEWGWKDWRAN